MAGRAQTADNLDLADAKRRIRALAVGSIGNLIEWYDVFAYAAFALYFSGSFFPRGDPVAQQLAAATLFAVAYLVRPIGGIIFGFLADRFGRRDALTASIMLMCFGSLLIAVTPTFATIGAGAPIVLALARVFQGLSQGGEYGTSATYLAEVADPERRGFYSGIWYVALIGGQLLALLVLLVLQKVFLTPEELKAWGWRIPFVIGAVIAFFGYFIRRDMPETELFDKARAIARERGAWRGLWRNWKPLVMVVGITIGGTSAFYTYTTYMQKFLKLSVGLSDSDTTLVTFGALVFAICLQPLYGALSDKVGRKTMLVSFGVLGTLGTYPLLSTLQQTRSPLIAFLLICCAWAIVSGYTAVTGIVKAELFPTAVRAMGVSIPYALTVALFGGSVDSVALWFKDRGIETGFYWYATGCIFISLCFYLSMRDTKRHSRMAEPV